MKYTYIPTIGCSNQVSNAIHRGRVTIHFGYSLDDANGVNLVLCDFDHDSQTALLPFHTHYRDSIKHLRTNNMAFLKSRFHSHEYIYFIGLLPFWG
eukprot:scaffold421147_cov47-Attheya_sp.AAC.2